MEPQEFIGFFIFVFFSIAAIFISYKLERVLPFIQKFYRFWGIQVQFEERGRENIRLLIRFLGLVFLIAAGAIVFLD